MGEHQEPVSLTAFGPEGPALATEPIVEVPMHTASSCRPAELRQRPGALTRLGPCAALVALVALVAPPAGAATKSKPAARPAVSRAGAASVGTPVPTRAAIYLSWNAPYGRPRAAGTLDAACGDTTIVDTLYLSVDPGRDAIELLGVSGSLYFHPREGEEISDFWKIKGGSLTGSPLRMVFGSDSTRDFVTPWPTAQGMGAPYYDFVGTSGRLRFIYAVPHGATPGVKRGKIYGFARLLIRRPASAEGGCGAPMCVEWHAATLGFGPKDEVAVNTGERWVSMNSPDGHVCDSQREMSGAKPWKPPGR